MTQKSTITPILLGLVVLAVSACAEAEYDMDENLSEATILEGTWSDGCLAGPNGQYGQAFSTYIGKTVRMTAQAYSDDQCTNPIASDINLRLNGTFTLEEGGKIDGKQLTKINSSLSVEHSEGLLASYYPVGMTFDAATEYFIDGDKMYGTDAYTDIFNDGSYKNATQIDVEYATRQ